MCFCFLKSRCPLLPQAIPCLFVFQSFFAGRNLFDQLALCLCLGCSQGKGEVGPQGYLWEFGACGVEIREQEECWYSVGSYCRASDGSASM